jgi:hypothetical protein
MTKSVGITPQTTETIMMGTEVGGTAGRQGTRVAITGDKKGIFNKSALKKFVTR